MLHEHWYAACLYDQFTEVWRLTDVVLMREHKPFVLLADHYQNDELQTRLYVRVQPGQFFQLAQSLGYSCSPRRLLGI